MKTWERSHFLITPRTKDWPAVIPDAIKKTEEECVFSDFQVNNEGRNRKLVCSVSRQHPDFAQNRRLIENAPDLLLFAQRVLEYGTEKDREFLSNTIKTILTEEKQ